MQQDYDACVDSCVAATASVVSFWLLSMTWYICIPLSFSLLALGHLNLVLETDVVLSMPLEFVHKARVVSDRRHAPSRTSSGRMCIHTVQPVWIYPESSVATAGVIGKSTQRGMITDQKHRGRLSICTCSSQTAK